MKIILTFSLAFLVVVGGTAAAGDPLTAVLDPYFHIHMALSDDTTDGVKADAIAIKTAARSLGEPGAPIVVAADALSAAADLGAARAAFGTLSDAVVAYSEKTKTAGDGVHTMYCPMVSKQWLQKGEKVANPYYGKAMLSCGEKKKST